MQNISGDYYDYTKTYAPERPYMISYDKTLTMKMFMASIDGDGTKVFINYEEALEKIIQTDNITRGIPKIIYLVGWQYNGHDSRYPAWHQMNEALKRPQDNTALESFFWLRAEAARYNTVISVHINMTDAYTDSPLWETYIQNDLIARHADGSYYQLNEGDIEDPPMYQVCYTNEWNSGYAKKRIDEIIDMLQLQAAATVHIDAFFARTSEYHGITEDMEMSSMRKIYRYWRDRGIDVTSEQQARARRDPFIGLQPMAWWFDLSREQQTLIHQQLACGGMPYEPNDSETGFLFGQCMQAEEIFSTSNFIPELKKQFCTTTLQTYYQNLHTFQSYNEGSNTTAYSGGLVIDAVEWSVKVNGRLMRAGGDVFIPAAWRVNKEILAFSEKGYDMKKWTLPPDWNNIKAVAAYKVTEKGLALKTGNIPVSNMEVAITLDAMEEVSIQPAAD